MPWTEAVVSTVDDPDGSCLPGPEVLNIIHAASTSSAGEACLIVKLVPTQRGHHVAVSAQATKSKTSLIHTRDTKAEASLPRVDQCIHCEQGAWSQRHLTPLCAPWAANTASPGDYQQLRPKPALDRSVQTNTDCPSNHASHCWLPHQRLSLLLREQCQRYTCSSTVKIKT